MSAETKQTPEEYVADYIKSVTCGMYFLPSQYNAAFSLAVRLETEKRELQSALEIADDFLNDCLARHDGSMDTEKFFKAGSAVHNALSRKV